MNEWGAYIALNRCIDEDDKEQHQQPKQWISNRKSWWKLSEKKGASCLKSIEDVWQQSFVSLIISKSPEEDSVAEKRGEKRIHTDTQTHTSNIQRIWAINTHWDRSACIQRKSVSKCCIYSRCWIIDSRSYTEHVSKCMAAIYALAARLTTGVKFSWKKKKTSSATILLLWIIVF